MWIIEDKENDEVYSFQLGWNDRYAELFLDKTDVYNIMDNNKNTMSWQNRNIEILQLVPKKE